MKDNKFKIVNSSKEEFKQWCVSRNLKTSDKESLKLFMKEKLEKQYGKKN